MGWNEGEDNSANLSNLAVVGLTFPKSLPCLLVLESGKLSNNDADLNSIPSEFWSFFMALNIVADIYDAIPEFLEAFVNYRESPKPLIICSSPQIIKTYFWTIINTLHILGFHLFTIAALAYYPSIPFRSFDFVNNVRKHVVSKFASAIFQIIFGLATFLLLRHASFLGSSARANLRTGILLLLITAILTIGGLQLRRIYEFLIVDTQVLNLQTKLFEYGGRFVQNYIPSKLFLSAFVNWSDLAGDSVSSKALKSHWWSLTTVIYRCLMKLVVVFASVCSKLDLTPIEIVAGCVYLYIFLPLITSSVFRVFLVSSEATVYHLVSRIRFRSGAKMIFPDSEYEDKVSSPNYLQSYATLLDGCEDLSLKFSVITFEKIFLHFVFTSMSDYLSSDLSKIKIRIAIWAKRQALALERRINLTFLDAEKNPVEPFSVSAVYCLFDFKYRTRLSGIAVLSGHHKPVVTMLQTRLNNSTYKIFCHDDILVVKKDFTFHRGRVRMCEFNPGRYGGDLVEIYPQNINFDASCRNVVVIGGSRWPLSYTTVLAQSIRDQGYQGTVIAALTGKKIPPISAVIAVDDGFLAMHNMFPTIDFVPDKLVIIEPRFPCTRIGNQTLSSAKGEIFIIAEDLHRTEVRIKASYYLFSLLGGIQTICSATHQIEYTMAPTQLHDFYHKPSNFRPSMETNYRSRNVKKLFRQN